MLCAVRLDVIRGCSITYCYSSRCSAETAKINLMVFAHVMYCVVELKCYVNICLRMTRGTAENNPSQWASTVRLAVYVTECIMIFTINGVTLLAFARNHRLRKRTTYLIINLTVADLLVGVVAEPIDLCYSQIDPGSILQHLIALKRLHATLNPFRHCLIEKKFYLKTIFCSWLLTLLCHLCCLFLSFLNHWQVQIGTYGYHILP